LITSLGWIVSRKLSNAPALGAPHLAIALIYAGASFSLTSSNLLAWLSHMSPAERVLTTPITAEEAIHLSPELEGSVTEWSWPLKYTHVERFAKYFHIRDRVTR
jgi:hypothetical protein